MCFLIQPWTIFVLQDFSQRPLEFQTWSFILLYKQLPCSLPGFPQILSGLSLSFEGHACRQKLSWGSYVNKRSPFGLSELAL